MNNIKMLKEMKIYRVLELPHGNNLQTIGVYDPNGIIYIKKDLPTLIQIVVLIHEVGHHINHKIGKFLYEKFGSFTLSICCDKLWNLFMEEKDALICKKWLPRTAHSRYLPGENFYLHSNGWDDLPK